MLVDVLFGRTDPILRIIAGDRGTRVKRLATGIYQIGHWNPEMIVQEKLESHILLTKSGEVIPEDWDNLVKCHRENIELISSYGVCDDYSQVLRMGDIMESPTPFVIFLVEIRKDQQPSDGGWRWHKWGEYIGTKEPQYEYIYDEPDIDRVYTFSIHKVTKPTF